jgi:hypothetical protein
MRPAVAGCLLLAIASVAVPQPASAHPPSIVSQSAEKVVADEIRAFRKSLAEAIAAKDKKRLGEMYAPSFRHTDESGRSTERDARMAAILAGKPVIETAPAETLVIRIPNDWVAVATGTSHLGPSADGKSDVVRWTAVYTRTDKSWWLVASHVSGVLDTRP